MAGWQLGRHVVTRVAMPVCSCGALQACVNVHHAAAGQCSWQSSCRHRLSWVAVRRGQGGWGNGSRATVRVRTELWPCTHLLACRPCTRRRLLWGLHGVLCPAARWRTCAGRTAGAAATTRLLRLLAGRPTARVGTVVAPPETCSAIASAVPRRPAIAIATLARRAPLPPPPPTMTDRHREAEKLYQEAVKLTTPSLLSLRMRGEWERATPLWERAAMMFKVRPAPPSTRQRCRRAARPSAAPSCRLPCARHCRPAAAMRQHQPGQGQL